jgi:hypothetical protein
VRCHRVTGPAADAGNVSLTSRFQIVTRSSQ